MHRVRAVSKQRSIMKVKSYIRTEVAKKAKAKYALKVIESRKTAPDCRLKLEEGHFVIKGELEKFQD